MTKPAETLAYCAIFFMVVFVAFELCELLELIRMHIFRRCRLDWCAPFRIGHVGGKIGIHERIKRKRELWGTIIRLMYVMRFLRMLKRARLRMIEHDAMEANRLGSSVLLSGKIHRNQGRDDGCQRKGR